MCAAVFWTLTQPMSQCKTGNPRIPLGATTSTFRYFEFPLVPTGAPCRQRIAIANPREASFSELLLSNGSCTNRFGAMAITRGQGIRCTRARTTQLRPWFTIQSFFSGPLQIGGKWGKALGISSRSHHALRVVRSITIIHLGTLFYPQLILIRSCAGRSCYS